jgi:hypothetical protein
VPRIAVEGLSRRPAAAPTAFTAVSGAGSVPVRGAFTQVAPSAADAGPVVPPLARLPPPGAAALAARPPPSPREGDGFSVMSPGGDASMDGARGMPLSARLAALLSDGALCGGKGVRGGKAR